jgi:hypothetical protein
LSDKFNKIFATGYVEINFTYWRELAYAGKFKKIRDTMQSNLDEIAKEMSANNQEFTF